MLAGFSKKIAEQLKLELPGFSAQGIMSPVGRETAIENMGAHAAPQISAVLMLLYAEDKEQQPRIVFIERSETEKGNHSGQIAFPGGKAEEADAHLIQTALREAEEEIGVNQADVEILGALSSLFIPVSNYLVHPFVGVHYGIPDFKKHPYEVKDIIKIRLNDLFSQGIKTKTEIFIKSRGIIMQTPCYKIEGKIIWGATAMIISEFEEIIRRIK